MVNIQPLTKETVDQVTDLALKLWPVSDWNELRQEFLEFLNSPKDIVYVAVMDGAVVGFIHMSLRSDYVEGSQSSPVGYVEGIYVEEPYRRKGISRKLVKAGEEWSRSKGCREIGSDAELHNQVSQEFHKQIGFREANRIVSFIKNIE